MQTNTSLSFLYNQPLKLESLDLQMLVKNFTMIRQCYMYGVSVSAEGKEQSNARNMYRNLTQLFHKFNHLCSLGRSKNADPN